MKFRLGNVKFESCNYKELNTCWQDKISFPSLTTKSNKSIDYCFVIFTDTSKLW